MSKSRSSGSQSAWELESGFEEKQDQLAQETEQWLEQQSRKKRKEEAHIAHVETKHMKESDDRSNLVDKAIDAAERAAAAASSTVRPNPKFRSGQSVHHYWASWFPGAGPGQHPTLRKGNRPAWYSAEIASVAEWKTDLPYAGSSHTGWAYLCY